MCRGNEEELASFELAGSIPTCNAEKQRARLCTLSKHTFVVMQEYLLENADKLNSAGSRLTMSPAGY